MFLKVVEKLLAALLLIALVTISIFVFHTHPLYGAEAEPTGDYARVMLGDLVLEQTAVQTGDHPGSDSAHERTLAFVPIATAAEHGNKPSVCDLPDRQEKVFQSIVRMGKIDNCQEVLPL